MMRAIRLIGLSFAAFILFSVPTSAEMIHLFARKGDVDAVLGEISKGVDPNLPSTRNTTETGVSPLFIAAKFGKADVVKALIDAGAEINALYDHSTAAYPYGTALHVAAAWGQSDVVKLLLEGGADPNAFHKLIGAPLQASREAGNSEITEMLLAAGATPKIHQTPVDHLIREADVANGKALAGACRTCHSMTNEPNDGDSPYSTLWNIVGREVASLEFDYSDALKDETGNWTYAALNSYMASPYGYAPGTKMYFGGVESPEERAAILAYLRTLSEEPVPLP